MTIAQTTETNAAAAAGPSPGPSRPARLDEPGPPGRRADPRLKALTPNWFAAVMGTGILAVVADRLPAQAPGLHNVAIGFWALACISLLVLILATVLHWARYPEVARTHHHNPVMAHFYGAVPMAFLTVGAATLLAGSAVIGTRAAVDTDWVLWAIGTVGGLTTATAVPHLTFTRLPMKPDSAFGGWLMPIVPPMVSASTGALLLPHVSAGEGRLDLLLGCYAMFGLSLVASVVVIVLVWFRLAVYKTGEAAGVPTLWIVLGPIGQSVTAANLLGANAHPALPAGEATVLRTLGIAYGIPMLGFAALWASIAAAVTVRTARDHLPFSLTWWSFTFPVGTVATGFTSVAVATGSTATKVGAVVAFAALVLAWSLVATRTVHGVLTGRLFVAQAAPAPCLEVERPAMSLLD